MSPDPAGRVSRRLRRILLLVPYAIHHPGVSLGELAEKFNVPRAELERDLELLFLCGLPGYGPGDLIDVALDGDRVYVDMADYFAQPLRLTPAEALSLYAGAAAVAALPGMAGADALRRGLVKLGRALGVGSGDSGAEIDVELGPPTPHLEALRGAIESRTRIRLGYYSASRGEMTTREADPWGLIAALGSWYLVAWDHHAGDERMFRVDRISSVETTDEDAVVPDDFDPEEYRGIFRERSGQGVMTLEISPEVARWFSDYYPVRSNRAAAAGWQEVELAYGGIRWAGTLVVSLGGAARNVRPREVLDEARAIATAIAARHGITGR